MQFHLVFEGDLKPRPKAKLTDIHAIRMALQDQIAALWALEPMTDLIEWSEPAREGRQSPYEVIDGTGFIPLVSSKVFTLAEVHVTILRDRPGSAAVGVHGDIDNRVKTLFDALRMPTVSELRILRATEGVVIPPRIYCLLEDDRLVTKLSVDTDRWLAKGGVSTLAIIKVTIMASRVTLANLSLIG